MAVRLAGLAILLLALCFPAPPAQAQTTPSPFNEYQHKAWYLYLIAQYTEWPTNAFHNDKAPLVIGILGEDPFGRNIDVIKDKPIKSHRVVVKYFKTVQEAEGCHVLYISASEQEKLPEIFKALDKSPTLTFGEMSGFLEKGGMVKFWIETTSATEGLIKFEVKQDTAVKAGLRINSRVLNLARPEKKTN